MWAPSMPVPSSTILARSHKTARRPLPKCGFAKGGLTEIADLVTNIRQGNYARGLVGAGSLLTVMAFLAGAGLFAAGYATGDSDLALAGSVLLTAVADCHLLCAHGAYRE
jgi:hypothetical protein